MALDSTEIGLPQGVAVQYNADGTVLDLPSYANVTTSQLDTVTSLRSQHITVPGATTLAVQTQPAHGRISVRSDGRLVVDLTKIITVPGDEIAFDLLVDGLVQSFTCPVSQGLQLKGWAPGWHFMPPRDPDGSVRFSTAVNHTVTHIDAEGGFTKAQIEAREGISNANQSWLKNNPASVGPDVPEADGVLRYGEIPELAVDSDRGNQIWGYKKSTGPGCHWLLFKRGTTVPSGAFGSVEGFNGLNCARIGAYGTGAKPIIQFALNGGSFCVIEGLRFAEKQNVDGQRFCMYYDCEADHSTNIRGSVRITEYCTYYKVKGWDFYYRSAPTSGFWLVKATREQGVYLNNYDGVAIVDCYLGQAGWQYFYRFDGSYLGPQPPTQYSHVVYSSGDGENLYIYNSVFEQGSLTGVQARPGVTMRDSTFLCNNLGILLGGGPDSEDQEQSAGLDISVPIPGAQLGNFSYAENPMFLGAGQKEQDRASFETARAINLSGNKVGIRGMIVADATEGNDGVRAHGVATEGEDIVINALASLESNDSEIAVVNWLNVPDKNVSVSQAIKDGTTLDAYAQLVLSDGTADRFDLFDYLRAADNPVAEVALMRDWVRTRLNKPLPTSPARTCLFSPPNELDTPGINWGVANDWSGGILPGKVAGDSVDLDNHRVSSSETPENPIETVDIGTDGDFTQFGGQLEVNQNILGGGFFRVGNFRGGAAEVVQHGGSFDPDLEVYAGRFRNDGALTFGGNVTVFDRGELLLGVDTSSAALATGRKFEVHGFESRVGFDGAAGGIASLTLAPGSTTAFRSTCVVAINGMGVKTAGQFKYGEVVTGETSGFTGIVARDVFTANQACTLYLRDVTGIPIDNENVIGVARLGRATTDPIIIGQINGTATFGMGTVGEMRSGLFEADPNVDSRVTLGGALEIDALGLEAGPYTLFSVDLLAGSYDSVSIVNGLGNDTVAQVGNDLRLTLAA
ncbi:hypothetical protein KX928_12525 [Roseobacter sp. YSTF-M11]|uniref:Uncharacterized protein n=1 Tax=Roseobacter insulae TaxID=2859783 RepID=A0A9X1FVP1_9RHOB|nr:hypothetical protein [Roseobacter insulae]MBW4708609.1 hypothetical protein [Roseobacter insulae]